MNIRFVQSPKTTSSERSIVTRRFLQLIVVAGLMLLGANASAATRNVPGTYPTIQDAVNASAPGDTILVAAGTYTENITIDRRVILQGAGSGNNPLVDTIIQSAANDMPVITLTVGGDNATDRLVIQSVRVRGASSSSSIHAGSGITLEPGVLGYLTFDHITVLENTANGIDIDLTTLLRDIVVRDSTFTKNAGTGFRAPAVSLGIDGLEVSNSHFDGNGSGFTAFSQSLTNWNIHNSTFNDNIGPDESFTGGYGLDIEGHVVQNLTIDCSDFSRNKGGAANGDNISSGVVLFPPAPADLYSNITVTHSQFNDNPFAGILIQPEVGSFIQNVTLDCNAFARNGYGILIFDGGVITSFSSHHSNIAGNTTAGLENDNAAIIDATTNWWGDASGPNAGPGTGTGDAIINGGTGAVLYMPLPYQSIRLSLSVYTYTRDQDREENQRN